MKQIINLTINELIKILKKTSTKVMLLIAVLMIFLALAFTNFIKYTEEQYTQDTTNYKEEIKSEIKHIKEMLETQKDKIDNETKIRYEVELEMYRIALDNEIDVIYYSHSSWKSDLYDEIYSETSELYYFKETLTDEEIIKKENSINKKIEILKNNELQKYIEYAKQELKIQLDEKQINQEQYDNEKYIIELKEKYNIYNVEHNEYWKIELINEIQRLQENIRTNMDSTTGKILTHENIKEQKDTIKIDEFRIANNMAPTDLNNKDYRNAYDYMSISISLTVIAIMMMVIAGGIVSNESSKGTIKFLTMTPNKRWKILLAKIISITILLIVITIALTIISNIVGNIAYPDSKVQDYIYVGNDGEVKTINHTLYTILYALGCSIDIFVFMILALMLSTITRNTAISVSISIASFIGGDIIMTIINQFVTKDWVKFIPFNNTGVVNKIFPNAMSYTSNQYMFDMINNVSIWFNLGVLGVCLILMLVTMFDSFNKRDIV